MSATRSFPFAVTALIALACGAVAQAGSPRVTLDLEPQRSTARAAPLQGRLELEWGDAAPGSQVPHVFKVAVVDDAGRRHELDPDQALRAAGDLYALYQRRVAVSLVPQAQSKTVTVTVTATGLPAAEAIVPVDDLAPVAPQGGRPLPKAGEITSKVAGVTVWATLMCKFSDIATEQKTLSFFQGQYGTAIGQLDHYWREVSYNQINLTGSAAYGWYTLPQPRSYYVTKDADNKDKADLTKLFQDCIAAADADVNFAANGGLQGVNMMFNGDLDGYAWGGSRCATLDGINKCWSTTWNPPWSFNNLAPLSHEMGHAYGLPHANNSDGDTDPYDNPWDVMSDGWSNAVKHATYGSLPKHINIYSRNRLGWVAAARKATFQSGEAMRTLTIDRASLAGSGNVQMLTLSYPDSSTRYYTVEVRMKTGNYEAALAGNAVIIHEVQTSRKEPSWSVDASDPPANRANNEGSMFKVGERWISPDGLFRVTVLQATTNGFVVELRGVPPTGGPGRMVRTSGSASVPAPVAASASAAPAAAGSAAGAAWPAVESSGADDRRGGFANPGRRR